MTNDRLAIRRFTLVALILPAAIVLAGVAIQLIVLPTLPNPVAIHWGFSGAPDGFGPVWLTPVITVAIGFGVPALLAAGALGSMRRGDRGFAYRVLGGVALGLAALLSVLGTGSMVAQSGVEDAAAGPTILLPLLTAFVAALGAGAIGWKIQPHEPWQPSAAIPTGALALAPGERAVWLQRVSIARSGAIILVATVVLMVVLTFVIVLLTADPLAIWIMIGITLFLLATVVTTLAFHVRVGDDGLSVNSVVGWPGVHVPLADVESATVVDVKPMGEFGGWGMRWGPAGFGVVLRSGAGIQVRRRSGKTVTVTVDDAATGAALLNTLVSAKHRDRG